MDSSPLAYNPRTDRQVIDMNVVAQPVTKDDRPLSVIRFAGLTTFTMLVYRASRIGDVGQEFLIA